MTYQEQLYDGILEDIFALTARPDLEAETELALRTATVNAHLCDAFPRDLFVSSVQLPNASYMFSMNIPSLFPGLRGLSQIRLLDSTMQPVVVSPENEVKIIELGDIYDDYGNLKNQVAYLAGDSVNVRSYYNTYGVLVSWFKSPSLRRAEYNSWIAQLYSTVIVYWAASIVLDTNGNEAKAKKYMDMTQQIHIPFLKNNFLLGELR
jgi:hypothetical protein